MALPTASDLKTMDYSYRGLPFVSIAANSSVNLTTMDYAYRGLPFVANPAGAVPPPAGVIPIFMRYYRNMRFC